jgi:hypothetical protein
LKGVKGSDKAKQLSSTLIPKYFKYFPKHTKDAINALLDLCEDDVREVRILAIRGLPPLCKGDDNIKNVALIGSGLFQMLPTDDIKELEVVNAAIQEILNIDPIASLHAMFEHIAGKEDLVLREKNLEFFKTKIIGIEALMKLENVEKLIDTEIKKILPATSHSEFLALAEILMNLKMNKDVDTKKTLFSMAVARSGIDKINVNDKAALTKLFDFINSSLSLLGVGGHVSSSPFFVFFIKSVLPVFDKFDDREKLHVVRTLAEVSKFTTTSDAKSHLGVIYQLLLKYLPQKNKEGEKEPFFNFSNIESLLYVFIQLGHKSLGSLNPICGIKINTGQPTDDIGDYKELFDDLSGRLTFCKEQAHNIRYNSQQAGKAAAKEFHAKTEKTPEEEKKFNDDKARSQLAGRIMSNILNMSDLILKKEFVSIHEIYLSWKKLPEKKPQEKKAEKKQPEKKQGEKKQGEKKQPEKKQQGEKRKNDNKEKNAKKKK